MLSSSVAFLLLLFFFFAVLLTTVQAQQQQQDFSPYTLNGGLVTAVAGRNYVLLATDTRMMDGSYEIYTRRHLSSRLWSLPSSSMMNEEDREELEEHLRTSTMRKKDVMSDTSRTTTTTTTPSFEILTSSPAPVFIGSSGCAADCEALKRYMKMDSIAHCHSKTSSHTAKLGVSQVATMLAHTLYGRRTFPYYAFCIVGGLLCNNNNDGGGGGAVYVYDAIGSYEQVAVASTGTGRDQMQPILDRLFGSSSTDEDDDDAATTTTTTWPAPPGVLPKVVPTQVDCSAVEALERIKQAYHAVAEREIGVGDSVVVVVMEKTSGDNRATKTKCSVFQIPLKQH